MPLEDLDAYRSDSGSSSQSRNSETVPKSTRDDCDSNATEAESIERSRNEESDDGRSDDSDQHTPAQKSKRRSSPASSSRGPHSMMMMGHQSRKASCQIVMIFSGRSVTSAVLSVLALYGSSSRRGARIMCRQMIFKERLRELWQSLCMMQSWKSLRNTIPGQFPIFG